MTHTESSFQVPKHRKRAQNTAPTGRVRFPLGAAPTLAQSQYQKIRNDIISMALPPGTPISETELAAQSGVSRTPIREAILRLARENLVEVVPKSGTFVARIPVSALPEALIARCALECATARAAAQVASRSQILELHALLERQRELAAQGDMPNFHLADEDFHEHVAVIGGLPGLWTMIQNIKLQVDRFRRLTLPEVGRMTMVIEEHAAVVAAIEARDTASASAAMEHHLTGLQLHVKSVVEAHPDYFIHDTDLNSLLHI
ncbi:MULTISPECIES: GntR family transcriptional regulator [Alphaproteobacteria]|uniref:GntR family transcriptional regulator n=1 Tax=Alphaproteobacteria TaxID=28211 RepID=UPI003A8CD37C